MNSADEEMCCADACTVEGEEKYYSIDTRHNMCGECCMDPKDYNKYHLFEPGLKKAEDGDTSPCTTLEYPNYDSTVTHGSLNIKMTLDLYNPVEEVSSEGSECCVGACEVEGEEKYYSIDTRHDLCGECCMKPSLYGLYHLFEKSLVKAEDGDLFPCEPLGFPKYTETVTHGVWPVTMTLDLYDHADAKLSVEECAEENLCVFSDSGATECCSSGEMCIQGVGCRC